MWIEKQIQKSSRIFRPRSYVFCFAICLPWDKCILIYTYISRYQFANRETEKITLTRIAINQVNKQNSAVIKGNEGASGLTEDKYTAAFRWKMVAEPEISRRVD